MSIHRHAAKRDANEPDIIKRFRLHGWHCEQVSQSGMPDLLVWPEDPTINLPHGRRRTLSDLVDVKDGKGQPTPTQVKKWTALHALGIPVYVVRTDDDVDAIVGGTLAPWEPERITLLPNGGHLRSPPRAGAKAGRADYAEFVPPGKSDAAKARRGGAQGGSKPTLITDTIAELEAASYTPPRSKPVGRRCSKGCGNHGWDNTPSGWVCSDCAMPPAEPVLVDAAKEAEVFAPPEDDAACIARGCHWPAEPNADRCAIHRKD